MCSQKAKRNHIKLWENIFIHKEKIQHCNKQLKHVNLYSVQDIFFFIINTMEIQGLMLYFKNSSNQAFNSSDEFLMNMYFSSNVGYIYPQFFPFSLLLIPRWKLENSFLFLSQDFTSQGLILPFFPTKEVQNWSMYLLGSINQQKKNRFQMNSIFKDFIFITLS